MSEYPSEYHLKIIKEYDVIEKSIHHFLAFIETLWWNSDSFILTGKRVYKLELHTVGWSGNEDIIGALKDNIMFWAMYWQKSLRGGHYYFRIPLEECDEK